MSEIPGKVPDSINCHACGAAIDLTGEKPFTHAECPRCNALSVVPVQFGNFLLLNPLGIGGMGTVYKAIDLSLSRSLALKILRSKLAANPDFIERFSREARAAAAVTHPNIAQVYSFGEIHGQYYLTMELLERGSLDDRLATQGKIPEKDVLEIGAQIAAGLRAAQQRGLLHRDVKPGNILFNEEGVPKIVDFGLARVQHEEASGGSRGPEQIWGTPYYIAPEKLRGQPEDFRSDMYSLGATLFHALAGRPPHEAATAGEVVAKHATQPVFSLKAFAPQTHDYTTHVIARMLAKNPAERYESYDELIRDLNEAQNIMKLSETSRIIVAPTGERVSVWSIVASIVGLVACVIIGWYVFRHLQVANSTPPPPPPPPPPVTTVKPVEPPGTDTPKPRPRPVEADVVDFSEDTAWVKAWNAATLQLALGRYKPALDDYNNANELLRNRNRRARQWVLYFQGLACLVADWKTDARTSFVQSLKLGLARPEIPAEITTGNFVDPLAYFMVGDLPLETLQTALPKLPRWAAALSYLSIGFKQLEKGELEKAGRAFRQYQNLPVDEKQRWAFNLQPLAENYVRRCEAAVDTVNQIDQLSQQKKYADALALLYGATNSPLPALKTILEQREQPLLAEAEKQQEAMRQQQEEAERARMERLARERAQAEAEIRQVLDLDPAVAGLWPGYNFKGVLDRYEGLPQKPTTADAAKLYNQRVTAVKLLMEFKAGLITDFARRPYDRGDLRDSHGIVLAGSLGGGTDTKLKFKTPYGEVLIDWSELTPAVIMHLAKVYATQAAPAESPDNQARRYLRMAMFCKQYNMESAAKTYGTMATQLSPAVQPEVDLIFGTETTAPSPAVPAPSPTT